MSLVPSFIMIRKLGASAVMNKRKTILTRNNYSTTQDCTRQKENDTIFEWSTHRIVSEESYGGISLVFLPRKGVM